MEVPQEVKLRIEIRKELLANVDKYSERLKLIDDEIREYFRAMDLLKLQEEDEDFENDDNNCSIKLEGKFTSFRIEVNEVNKLNVKLLKVKTLHNKEVFVSEKPMGKGSFRLAYFAKMSTKSNKSSKNDNNKNNDIILIEINNNNNNNNNNKLEHSKNGVNKNVDKNNVNNEKNYENDDKYIVKTQKSFINEKKACLKDIESQLLAEYFANKFNEISKKLTPLYFTKIFLFKLKKKVNFFGAKYLICEEKISGKFTKFNNNVNFINKITKSSTAQTFSHFTYHFSNSNLMIVDI